MCLPRVSCPSSRCTAAPMSRARRESPATGHAILPRASTLDMQTEQARSRRITFSPTLQPLYLVVKQPHPPMSSSYSQLTVVRTLAFGLACCVADLCEMTCAAPYGYVVASSLRSCSGSSAGPGQAHRLKGCGCLWPHPRRIDNQVPDQALWPYGAIYDERKGLLDRRTRTCTIT